MRSRSTQHKFVHYVNLKSIQDEIEVTKSQLSILDNKIREMNNESLVDTGLNATVSQALQLISNTNMKLENLTPTKNLRPKRGLINAIGTASKWLFGTLDDSDRKAINRAISRLNKNNDHIEQQLKTQITVTTKLINNYNKTINTLVQNQRIIKNFLTQTINDLNDRLTHLLTTISVQNALTQLLTNLTYINEFLDELENAIVFASWNLIHNSILSKNDLFHILEKAEELYSDQSILKLNHFQNYYSYLGASVHFIDGQIVFVIYMPILTAEIYSYYHLIPVPVQNLTIIPANPYLGMSTEYYIASPETCPKIEDIYICNRPSQIKDDSCLIQLLSNADHSHCQVHHVLLTKSLVSMLEENYVLVVPASPIQVPNCQNGIKTLTQPAILQLPKGCSITIGNQRFSATKTEIQLPIFQLPRIEIPQLWNLTVNRNSPLHLKEVDLPSINSLTKLARKIETTQFVSEPAALLGPTSNWLFIVILIIICIIIVFLIYNRVRYYFPSLCRCLSKPKSSKVIYNPNNSSPGDDATTSAGGIILVSR